MSATDNRPLIAHIVFRLDYGGLENGLVNLVNNLPAERYRHAIICLTGFGDFRNRISRPDVEVHALGKRPGKDLAAYVRLWRMFRRLRPSIVHTRNAGTLDCALVAFLAGVAVRVHGYHGWDVDDLHGTDPRRRFLRRILHPFVTHFVTVSRHIADWLANAEGIPSSRITHICNGVDTRRFSPRDAGSGSNGAVRIGTVGRLEAVKNQALLVRAIELLLAAEPDLRGHIEVRLIGDGGRRGELQQQIRTAGLADVVSITGWHDDVPRQLQQLDLFVLPSLNEGISNTILEALACGLPVIATDVGGNPELVIDGVTGALVPVGDPARLAEALRRYVEAPEMRAAHGAAARLAAEEGFSLEVMTAAYGQLYQGMLATVDRDAPQPSR